MTTWPEGGREPMDEDRLDALLQRATSPAQSKKDQVSRLLDFLVWSLAKAPQSNRDTTAKARAKVLAKAPERWAVYVVLSDESPLVWKTLQALVRDLWRQDPPSPDLFFMPGEVAVSPLLHWVMDVATGKRKEPKKRGPDPTANLFRDVAITVFIREIARVGGVKAPKACDLVVERLKNEGHKRLNYEHVYNNVWLKNRQSLDDEAASQEE